MKQAAVDAAWERLRRVQQARDQLGCKLGQTGARDAWASFLLAANGVYAKLEQGAKGHGASEAWFGRKKRERKDDQLLSYIHHARNSEEHSIEGSEASHGPYVTSGNKWTKIQNDGLDGNPVRYSVMEGKKLLVKLHGWGIHLIPVRDRGVTYSPPEQHLGQPLKDRTIHALIEAAANYLETMIAEASALEIHEQ